MRIIVILGLVAVILVIYGLMKINTPEGAVAYEARRRAYRGANRHGKQWLARRLAEINEQEKAAKEARINSQ